MENNTMETSQHNTEPLWKAREAARCLSLGLSKFYELVELGEIPVIRIPSTNPQSTRQAQRFDPQDIRALRDQWKRGVA